VIIVLHFGLDLRVLQGWLLARLETSTDRSRLAWLAIHGRMMLWWPGRMRLWRLWWMNRACGPTRYRCRIGHTAMIGRRLQKFSSIGTVQGWTLVRRSMRIMLRRCGGIVMMMMMRWWWWQRWMGAWWHSGGVGTNGTRVAHR
jgi:hypothetical protein